MTSKFVYIVLLVGGLLQTLVADNIEVKWGLILPLSGPVAKAGVDIRRGFEMALEDLDQTKVKHTLVSEDSQYQLKEAVSAANKLISIDQVDLLVALWETADVVAPLAERSNKVHASIRWNNNIAKSFKNTFTFESTYEDYAELFIKLFSKLGLKKIVILNQEANGWNLALEVLKRSAEKYGITISAAISYLGSENDYRVIALKALSTNPDIILINDSGENLEVVTRQIKTLNSSQRVTGYLGYPIDLSLFENEYFIDQLSTSSEFANRYEAKYREPVYIRAQLAYDLMSLLGKVYNSFESKPDTESFISRLKEQKDYQGVSGLIRATDEGKVFRTKCVVRRIVNGASVDVFQDLDL